MLKEIFEKDGLPSPEEMGKIKIFHLKRFYSKLMAKKESILTEGSLEEEWPTDITLLHTIGLGIEQVYTHLFRNDLSFDEFENWILEINGGIIADEKIQKFNAAINGQPIESNNGPDDGPVLNEVDLAFWKENGYLVIHDAVSPENIFAAEQCVWDFLEMDKNDRGTWYKSHPARQGIMVQFFQHPALQANRDSEKIRRAYEQLWGTKDIWVSMDRVSFNPPENEQWSFPGPRLHWDTSLELPIPFGLQGLLYLTDTEPNQGAFTLVPGFQNRIENWLNHLAPGTNPRTEDIYALGATPIAGKAGDFIIWHQALPHGSAPNTANLPRIVQYINWAPAKQVLKTNWK